MRAPVTALLLASVALWSRPAAAQLFDEATTAADLALVGTAAALGGRGAGAFANPASLIAAGTRLQLGLGLQANENTYIDEEERGRDLVAPQPLGYALGSIAFWRRRFVAAIGYRRRLPAMTEHAPAPDENEASSLRFLGRRARWGEHEAHLALAARWRVIAFGAALSVTHATVALQRTLFAGADADRPLLDGRSLDVDLDADLSGFGVAGRLGLVAEPWWWLRAALTVDTPRHTHLTGDATFSAPTRTPSGVVSFDLTGGRAETDIRTPWRVGAALQMHATRQLRLFFGWDVRLGGARRALLLDEAYWRADTRELPLPALELIPAPHLAHGWRVAAELAVWGGRLRLRGGWAYSQGSLAAHGLGAPLVDQDRHQVGFGVALVGQRLELAVAVRHDLAATLALEAGLPVVAPLVESGPLTAPAGRIETTRTQMVLEVAVPLS